MDDFDDQDYSMARIHISLPVQFLKKVDCGAINQLMSRSDFIRLALMEKLNVQSLFEQELKQFTKPYLAEDLTNKPDLKKHYY